VDAKQYKGLRELINQNEDTPKAELEKKIGEWSKTSGLEVTNKQIFNKEILDFSKILKSSAIFNESTAV
jgi:hypothetical protein